MKTISAELKAHLAQPVTTLASCWRLVRTDGAQFAFTTADIDLVVQGVTYSAVGGFTSTAIAAGSTGEVDASEITGLLSSTGITERDLKNGLFNYAQFFLSVVNWADLSMGVIKMRRGWLGEVTRSQSGMFNVELYGLTKALQQEFGNVLMPICRADLGDSKCKVPINPAVWGAATGYAQAADLGQSYVNNSYVRPLTQTTTALRQAIFRAATVSGPTATSEPAWDTTIGATTVDGGVVWESVKPFQLIGTVTAPIDAHNFQVAPLSYPANPLGNTAVITIRNNVSQNTSLEISDGISTPINIFFQYDTQLETVKDLVVNAITTSGSGLAITAVNPHWSINLTNNSGHQGVITKTGDIADPSAFLITNFAPAYLDGGTVTWITGDNAGVSNELKTYLPDNAQVVTWLGQRFPIQAGDTFLYYPGCDKRRETCWQKFNNPLNMRCEPDVPGLDAALGYPDMSA